MKKTILMIASGIVMLAIVGIIFFLSQLDSIVQNMIEKHGSAITGVKVSVTKVEVSPASGKGAVNRLTIGNPPGYKSQYAFVMRRIDVDANVKSFMSDVVVINSIKVDSPEITYELGGKGGSNFKTIQDNINSYSPKNDAKDTESSKAVQINNLSITNGKITVSAPTLNQNFEVALPNINLTNLGKGGKQGNTDEVMKQVMAVVTSAVMTEVGKITIENFGKFMTDGTGGILQGTGDGLQGVGQGLEGLTEGIFGGSK